MVRHIQAVFDGFIRFLGKWAFPVSLVALVTLAVIAVLALLLYRTDREAFERAAGMLRRSLRYFGVGVFLLTVIFMQTAFLRALREGVTTRLNQASAARYTTEGESGGGETIQYVPSVTYNDTETRSQKLIIPRYTLNYINANGLNSSESLNSMPGWSPEDLRYDSRPIVSIEDQLEKDQNAIVVNRTFTINRFLPLKLKSTAINVKLSFKDQGNKAKRQYYQADFKGRYTFENSFDVKKVVHFSFPLPASSGTLSNFRFIADGKENLVQDVRNGYEWTGEVDAHKAVCVEVEYSHSGSRSWTCNLSSKREAISDFRLQVESNNAHIKFLRGALPPTRRTGTLGGVTLGWELKNLITSQDISLFFPSISKSELITRLYIFSPLALVGFILMLMGWAYIRKLEISPVQYVLASLAYSGSFALTGYLLTYMPLQFAILLSFAAGTMLNMVVLNALSRKDLLVPITIFALVPLAFMSVGNTGFLLCIVGMMVIGLCAHGLYSQKRCSMEPCDTRPMEHSEN